jgi:uncharacterized membrane protein (UPF0127 family)
MADRRATRWIAPAVLVLLMSAPFQGRAGEDMDRGTVTFPNGAVYAVEIPRTQPARERGLMFRRHLPPRTGMLFVFNVTGRYGFWMKNCLIPLDLIWIDETKRVAAILPNTPPCKADPCPIYQFDVPTRYVLEIPAGAAARENLRLGDTLKF